MLFNVQCENADFFALSDAPDAQTAKRQLMAELKDSHSPSYAKVADYAKSKGLSVWVCLKTEPMRFTSGVMVLSD